MDIISDTMYNVFVGSRNKDERAREYLVSGQDNPCWPLFRGECCPVQAHTLAYRPVDAIYYTFVGKRNVKSDF